jgi:WD40 repeat protein
MKGENGIIKEVVIIDAIYNFILKDNTSNQLMLFKTTMNKNIDNKQKEDNTNKIMKIESKIIDKKFFEKNINFIDGIIFTYNSQEQNNYENTIKFILEIEEKKPKGKFLPKIVLGEITNFQNLLTKEKRCIVSDIFFIKSETNLNINVAIQALIQMRTIDMNYQKFKSENKINEKQIINSLSKLKTNVMKCLDCNSILKINMNQFSNSIYLNCNKCNINEKFDICDFFKLKRKIKCKVCEKEINESLVNYSLKSKCFVCFDCTKNNFRKDKIYNNSLNFICNIHNKLFYQYCITCKKSICIECEIGFHMNHNIKIFNGKEILSLISKKKCNLDIEKENLKQMNININNFLKSLKDVFDKLLLYKEIELNIKEEIMKECELLKYENTLIENVKNLQFGINSIDYNNESSWISKLTNIFEYFNTPIKIEKTKICIKENLKGPYDILQPIEGRKSSIYSDEPENQLIDLVPLHNFMGKNYFAVGFSNGLLKIYNDDFENRIPTKIITAFEPSEEILFLSKSSEKSLLLVSYLKIKKISFSDDLKNYEVINSMEISDQLFKIALEIKELDALLTANSYNKLIFYDFQKGKQISNVTKYIDSNKEKEILFFDVLPFNKVIIKFSDVDDSIINNDTLIVRNTISIKNNNEPQKIYWKILEFEKKDNNIEIKKNYWLYENINYLGKINEELILISDPALNSLSIFDFNKYLIIFKLSFNYIYKPIVAFPLNKRGNIYDLLFLFEKGNLMQFSLNTNKKAINCISKIKINKTNLKNNTHINEQYDKNEIRKMVKLTKRNFLLVDNDKYIYYLKK